MLNNAADYAKYHYNIILTYIRVNVFYNKNVQKTLKKFYNYGSLESIPSVPLFMTRPSQRRVDLHRHPRSGVTVERARTRTATGERVGVSRN